MRNDWQEYINSFMNKPDEESIASDRNFRDLFGVGFKGDARFYTDAQVLAERERYAREKVEQALTEYGDPEDSKKDIQDWIKMMFGE